MSTMHASERMYVDSRFQIFLMVLTCAALLIVLNLAYEGFHVTDESPPVISLTPEKLFSLGGPATPIHTGIFVKNFAEFNIVKATFLVDLTIWFRFNPDHIPLDLVDKFTFQKAEIKSKSAPFVKIEEGSFLVSYDMRVLFYVSLNYRNFPIDDHRLSFIVDNYFISPAQAFFTTSQNNISVSSELHVEGWDLLDKAVSVGYFEKNIQDAGMEKKVYYPRAVFFFDFSQAGIRYIFAIFFPLLMLFFIALFSFSINPVDSSLSSLLDMPKGSLIALIAYRFVMESISPATGYFMMSDYVYLFFLVAILVVFFINMFGKQVTRRQKCVVLIALHLATICMFLYLFRPWL